MSLSAGLDLSARPNDEVKKKKTATCTIYSEAGPDDGPRERRTPERLYIRRICRKRKDLSARLDLSNKEGCLLVSL